MENSLGLTQVYWGDGKGKTSAALGTAIRACGQGFNVHLIQFMKPGAKAICGELRFLDKFETFSTQCFGADGFVTNPPKQEQIQAAKEAYDYLLSCFDRGYDMIIADEILYAVQMGLLDEELVSYLIKNKPKKTELILTGSHQPFPELFKLADLVTELKKHKHPYDQGVKARAGIEY